MNLGGNDNKKITQLSVAVVGTGIAILAILGIAVIPAVRESKRSADFSERTGVTVAKSQNASAAEVEESESGRDNVVLQEYDITSPAELDFWDLYPKDGKKPQQDTNGQIADTGKDKNDSEGNKTEDEGNKETDENDPSKDGKHTNVILRDGSEEWVTISSYLPKNDYDYSNLVCKDDRMEYYIDGKKVSYLGVDISKYQDYIDFNKVKKDGIDFVMIRVGVRGYGTGQITIDDYFYDNLKRATDAGLKVGVYFTSQAINVDEAVEEAALVVEALGEYKIDYPICFDMGFVKGDIARIEDLSPNDRTDIAKAFLDFISGQGYTGCIYGDKEWLIKEIEMSKLTAYDFWLSQDEDLPNYPYKFSIWQYTGKGTVDGISGYVNLNISFVDYTEK